VGVELASDGNVAVRVEAVDKFVSLVAEIALCGEVSWRSSLPGGVWGFSSGRRR